MGTHRHLRLVADGERPTPRPVITHPSITTVDAALAAMRLYAAIVESHPADLFSGFSSEEMAAQMAATDRLVATFRLLDELLTRERREVTTGVSKSGHPTHEKKES